MEVARKVLEIINLFFWSSILCFLIVLMLTMLGFSSADESSSTIPSWPLERKSTIESVAFHLELDLSNSPSVDQRYRPWGHRISQAKVADWTDLHHEVDPSKEPHRLVDRSSGLTSTTCCPRPTSSVSIALSWTAPSMSSTTTPSPR